MKNMITTTIAAGLVATGAFADAGVTADFASAYVFRGSTFNDGFVFQPGVEASGFGLSEECGSLAIGAWGNYDIDAPAPGAASSQFTEVDLYASYGLPTLIDGLDIALGWTEYTYPLGGVADKEASVGVGTEVGGVSLGSTAYFMVGGDFVGQIYVDFSASYAVEVSDELSVEAGATIGYIKQGDNVAGYNAGGADDGLNDGVFSIAATYALTDVWSVGVSGAYIAQLDDKVLTDINDPVAPGAYDVDFVGMFNLAASF